MRSEGVTPNERIDTSIIFINARDDIGGRGADADMPSLGALPVASDDLLPFHRSHIIQPPMP